MKVITSTLLKKMQIKLRQIGHSVGVTIAKEILDKFGLKAGDELNVVVTNCGIQLIPYESNFQESVAAYKIGSAKYRNAMKDLADG
jgi:putative addiction module antidote